MTSRHTSPPLTRSMADPHQLLTTDTSRSDAHRFYEQLGFVASHEGMKLPL